MQMSVEEASAAAESADNGLGFVACSGVISVAAAPAAEIVAEMQLSAASRVGVSDVRLGCTKSSDAPADLPVAGGCFAPSEL